MIDVSKVKYRVVVVDEKGKKVGIQDFITDLGWEENEKELASRISFTAFNKKTEKGRISTLVKLGSLILVFASAGGKEQEVARGYVNEWSPSFTGSTHKFSCKCYDNLYPFQQSQDNVYYSSGMGTKSILTKLFSKWGIHLGTYQGPNVTHAKLKYQNDSLGDIVLDVLKQAKKKGAKECFIRANKGKVDILPYGGNKTVYCFESPNNVISVSHSRSTSDLVTRVKVIGQSDDKKRGKVEAVLNGQTKKYGIRQKIVTKSKNDKLADAKKEAQQILNEQGKVKEEISIQSPDIPFLRKGDTVFVKAGTLNGYYNVRSIRHEADGSSMTMDLKKTKSVTVTKNKVSDNKEHKTGDLVNFHGGKHYLSSNAGAKGFSVAAGKAKITSIKAGQAHPYHLIHADSKSKVYGWVDAGTFD